MFAPVKRNAPLVGQVHQLLQRIKQLVFDGAACASGNSKYPHQFTNHSTKHVCSPCSANAKFDGMKS